MVQSRRYRHSSYSPYYSRSYGRQPKQPKQARRFPKRMLFLVAIIVLSVFVFRANTIHASSPKPAVSLYSKKQTVCIDPGHGGVDPGASSSDGLITERDINLTVALKMRSRLNADGYQVFMTRTTNSVSMDNHVRYMYCNQNHATVMVAIHHNFFTDSSVDYSSDLFYKPIDKGLASSIVNATSAKLDIASDGISQFDDGVLSESTMPAAVSEGFFITNSDEYDLLTNANSTRLSDEATGIVNGIESYLADPAKADASVSSTQILDRTDD